MMESLPSYTLTVSKSPSTDSALQDVLSLNPSETGLFQDGALCRLNTDQGTLHLPLKADSRVTVGTVGLSAFQRCFLDCEPNGEVRVSLIHSDVDRILPRVSKVWITILGRRREKNETMKTKKIVQQFQGKFKSHPLNQGHMIPLQLEGILYRIKIDRMTAFSEERKGVMKENCSVVPTFRLVPDKG